MSSDTSRDPEHPTAEPNARAGQPCLDAETLASFVEGTLPPAARRAVVEHLAGCDDCAELVAEVGLTQTATSDVGPAIYDEPMKDAEGAQRAPSSIPRKRGGVTLWTAAAVGLAALVLLAVGLSTIWSLREAVPVPETTRLAEAMGPSRPLEGRLTGFPHAPLRTPDRSLGGSENLALLAVAGELQRTADTTPSRSSLHAWGVAQLTLRQYDAGVETLEAAILEYGSTPALNADLAVGRLARATAADRPDDLPRALESLEEALRLDPNLAEAWFTKAIVLEKLQMPRQARDAWQKYLELDGASPWSNEARQRLADLESRSARPERWRVIQAQLVAGRGDEGALAEAVTTYPADVRDTLVRDLLPAWAARIDAPDVDEYLARATQIVERLEAAGPDRLFTQALAGIRDAGSVERRQLASGITELGAGVLAQENERPPGEIRQHLQAALHALGQRDSPLRLWAELTLARTASAQQAHDEVRIRAGAVAHDAQRLGAPTLESRAHVLLGMTAFTVGQWSDAARHYDRALSLVDVTREDAVRASTHVNASVLHRFLGNRHATWTHRLAAGDSLAHHRPLQVHTFLLSGAATASVEGLPLASLRFQSEVVDNASAHLRGGPLCEALVSRARMHARLARYDDATRDLEEARRLIATVSSEAMRARLTRAWLLASAETNLPADPAGAARDAGKAVEMIVAAGELIRSAEAALIQSRALARLADAEGALAASERGIAAFEQALGSMNPRSPSRISAVERVWTLYAEAARLQLSRDPADVDRAFALTERGRARTLLELRRVTPLSLADVRARLRNDQAVLVLDQADDDVVFWWITLDGVQTARVKEGAHAVNRLVAAHRRSIDRGERRHAASARLFDLAIRRWWSDLRKKSVVAVIADGAWNGVAWPALWDEESGQELVDTCAVVVAPSVAVALSRAGDAARHPRSALVVSAPSTPAGPQLAAARLEAGEIARMYQESRMLGGAEATPEGVLKAALDADVIHISSHAHDVPAYPQHSYLALAGEAPAANLFVRDIVQVDLDRTHLAVLAACATVGRTAVRGEGSVGVAWGFLTAGVRHVIATLQEVEDGPARLLFTQVHQRIARGEDPVRALHNSQRALAAAGESPRLWAAVTILGAL